MSEHSELTLRRSGWTRLNGPNRVAGVDFARGLAVLGMLAAHLISVPAFEWADASTWAGVVSGRSSILFATLAGVSIGLVTGGTQPLQGEKLRVARGRLVVRAGAIWMLGFLLIATGVPVYVILPAYAILFLLMLPLLRLEPRWLFLLAAGLAVIMPAVQFGVASSSFWQTNAGELLDVAVGGHYPVLVWSAFVVTGLGIARTGFTTIRSACVLLLAGAACSVVGYALGAAIPVDGVWWAPILSAQPHASGIGEVLGSGGFAIAAIGLCVLACKTPLTWLVLPLRAVGSMPLTAYTAQLVAWVAAALALGLEAGDLYGFRALEPFWPFAVWTIIGCTAWALLVGRGPLEWGIGAVARAVVPGGADRLAR